MFKSGSTVNKYSYMCGSKIVQGKPCGKKSFTAYQLEHTVLQLIADHVWNNNLEDKTAWFEQEIRNEVETLTKLLKLATLTDSLEELADQINVSKQKRLTIEREFRQYKSSRAGTQTTGWEQFKKFDVHDTKNPTRKGIRLRIKQAIKRIDAYDLDDERHNYFILTFADDTQQKIVIKKNRNRSPGISYIDTKTVNNHKILEMEGLVLHTFIDALIDPAGFTKKCEELQELARSNRTIISELEDEIHQDGKPKPRIPFAGIAKNDVVNESYATIDGVKYKIDSIDELESLLEQHGKLE